MNRHNLENSLNTAMMGATGQVFYDESTGGRILGWGTAVPSGDADWSPNAIFIHTDGGAAARVYVNTGSVTSCTFSQVGDIAYADYMPLAGGTFTGDVTMTDGEHIVLGTTSGSKIGTSASQKLGFFNATAIVQPAAATQAACGGSLTGTTDDTLADVSGSWDATAIATINKNFKELQELTTALRLALVNLGLIKGSA